MKKLPSQASTTGLVAHYKLWAGFTSTGKVFDYTNNGNKGTVSGALPKFPGFFFDGAVGSSQDDFISIAADSTIDANGKTALTISAWINPASDGENDFGRIIDHATDDGATAGYLLRVDSEAGGFVNCLFKIVTSGVTVDVGLASALIPLNTWSHIVCTHDINGDAKGRIYLNGVLVATDNVASTGVYADDSAETLVIGNSSNGTRTFDGLIDDVMLFNAAKTATEIRNIYELTRWRYGR